MADIFNVMNGLNQKEPGKTSIALLLCVPKEEARKGTSAFASPSGSLRLRMKMGATLLLYPIFMLASAAS